MKAGPKILLLGFIASSAMPQPIDLGSLFDLTVKCLSGDPHCAERALDWGAGKGGPSTQSSQYTGSRFLQGLFGGKTPQSVPSTTPTTPTQKERRDVASQDLDFDPKEFLKFIDEQRHQRRRRDVCPAPNSVDTGKTGTSNDVEPVTPDTTSTGQDSTVSQASQLTGSGNTFLNAVDNQDTTAPSGSTPPAPGASSNVKTDTGLSEEEGNDPCAEEPDNCETPPGPSAVPELPLPIPSSSSSINGSISATATASSTQSTASLDAGAPELAT